MDLAVYGPNRGALLEIEVTVIPAKIKDTINITGIVEEESIGNNGNPFDVKVWQEVRLKM